MKKIITLILIIGLCLSSLYATKTVRVGWYSELGLQEGNSENTLGGYNFAYLKKIQSYTDWDYDFVFGDKSALLKKLSSGDIDFLCSIAKTNELEESLNFSTLPISYNTMLVLADVKDDIAFNDFKKIRRSVAYAFDFSDERLENLKNNLELTILEVPDDYNIFNAIDDGRCDLIIVDNATQIPHDKFKVVYQFETQQYSIAVNKEKTDLLNQLNFIQSRITKDNPYFDDLLFEEYLDNSNSLKIALQSEYVEYINNNPSVIVGYRSTSNQFLYTDGNSKELKGPFKILFDNIKDDTGLNFIYKEYDSDLELNEDLKNGVIDIAAGIVYDYSIANKYEYDLTQPFVNLQKGFVLKKSNFDDIVTIALPEGEYIPSEIENLYEVKTYSTVLKALLAVSKGEVDAAYLNIKSFQMYYDSQLFNNLSFTNTDSFLISCGVSNKDKKTLYSIIQHSIFNLNQLELKAINSSCNIIPLNLSLIGIMGLYKEEFALILFALIVLITPLVVLHNKNRERKKQIEKLESELETMQVSDHAKLLFLSSLSRDLRTPLNLILGNSEVALKEINEENKMFSPMKEIQSSSNLILNIINEMLDMNCLEQRKLILNENDFNIEEVIESVHKQTNIFAKEKKLRCTLEMDITHPLVKGDKQKLIGVLRKLTANSAIFTNKGTISIVMKERQNTVNSSKYIITVSDTGVGMNAEQLSHIYEGFGSVNESSTSSVGCIGLGHGLAIVKIILDKMGATLKIESELNVGTTCTIVLPLPYTTEVKSNPLNAYKTYDLSKYRALIVEDIEVNTKILTKMLSLTNIKVSTAKDGKEAVSKFKMYENYDIIFMDLKMPVMDGYDATRAIRAIGTQKAKDVPIIAISADAFETDVIQVKEAGMNEHCSKPVEMDNLLSILKKYLIEQKNN